MQLALHLFETIDAMGAHDAASAPPIRPAFQLQQLALTVVIHSLYRLDKPSLTLVVRTRGGDGPQYTYERSGLAYDPFLRVERSEKALQALDVEAVPS